MDGQQWLATIFNSALQRDSLAYTDDADLLRGQLAALHDCGVLDNLARSAMATCCNRTSAGNANSYRPCVATVALTTIVGATLLLRRLDVLD